ncbi:MAG: ABC transporter permease [Microgenomates group bacterium Gr01-1014_16]|nr:MAG: ABC transporter permease [Microgenomates group bacterium Gr01-1014_16]
MRKYFTVFAIDWQNQFIYRLNFILWRFRNVLRVLMTYYLWISIFSSQTSVFGYTKEQMIAYLLLALFISSLVTSSPSNDNVGGEVSNGTLNNFLVKPIGYLRYWFTRDLSSKLINIIFAVGEISLLYIIFRPSLYVSPNLISLLLLVSAVIIYFLLGKLAISIVFWAPENTWGFMFTILVLMEMFTGLIFPLDLLPHWAFSTLQFTPFPYLIYFPLASIIGKPVDLRILLQSFVWMGILYYLLKKVWAKGLKTYSASGI